MPLRRTRLTWWTKPRTAQVLRQAVRGGGIHLLVRKCRRRRRNAAFRFPGADARRQTLDAIGRRAPQTIALVVSHLPPDRAADVLGRWKALQVEVLRRLVDLDEADPNVLREVENGLKSRILEQIHHEGRLAAGLNTVAGIVEAAEPGLKRALQANLARHDRRLAGHLRPQTCEFADLERMDQDMLAVLLSEVDPEVTLLALAAAPLGLVDRVLGQLSPQDAKRLRRTIECLGPTRLADIDEAQRRIAERALQLALDGRIELP